MMKFVDRLLHRMGYVRWDRTIQGEVQFRLYERPFVTLTIPGGQRVQGYVDTVGGPWLTTRHITEERST